VQNDEEKKTPRKINQQPEEKKFEAKLKKHEIAYFRGGWRRTRPKD